MKYDPRTYPAPRSPPILWLVSTGADVAPGVKAELRAILLRRMSSLIAASLVGSAVAMIAMSRQGTLPFGIWLALDLCIMIFRITVVKPRVEREISTRSQDSGMIDLFVMASLAWTAMVGYGVFLCLSSDDLVLASYGSILALGLVGGMCARNPGTPRMTMLQMMMLVAPLVAGAVINSNDGLMWVAILAPPYLAGIVDVNRQLHFDYIEMISTRLENQHAAMHCGLTGLPNRFRFDEMLIGALGDAAASHDVTVLCLDLDGFKAVNDKYGHPAGDEVLRQAAARLQASVGAGGIVARTGGDEFAALVLDATAPQAETIARAMIASIARPYNLGDGQQAEIGVSIGIACGAGSARGHDQLLHEADQALYAAKQAGKGKFCWFGNIGNVATPAASVTTLRDLVDAMRRDTVAPNQKRHLA